MLKAIIVDDINSIREKNIELIKRFCPNVQIIAEANSVSSAIECIQKNSPDLVFLDVELRDGNGFDVLQKLKPITFKVIFITAYQDFAVKAFRFSAIDFLLKPIDPSDLIEAVKKAEEQIQKEVLELKIDALFANMEKNNQAKKIVLKTAERIFSVNIQDIVRCESYKNYTQFFLNDGQKLLVSTTLKDYDTMLAPMGFFRAHQSHLINMTYFDHYLKADGGIIVMKDKSQVPVSVRKKEELLALIEML